MANTVKTTFIVETAEANRKVDKFKSNLADTAAIDKSLNSISSRLKSVDSELDKTVAASNKLGDSSATVARRYEKLGEGIALQNIRLKEASAAFAAGEINAKKYASVLASVETQTRSLSSRIKDANARVTEISETGLTHFQNQIAGSVTGQQQGGIGSILRNLSYQQKTQLSFQLNDVISGLAMGQNPMQILAQQGGQILQVFQQTKVAQEGTAAATTAASTAQAAMAASSKATAVSAAVIAVESQTTAAGMQAAAAAQSTMGAGLVAMGVTLAAGIAVIAAAYKLSSDIRTEAERRLKTEEKITAEWNKQINLAGQLKDRLKAEAGERAFNRFSSGDDLFGLTTRRDILRQQYDANAKAVQDEVIRRNAVVSQLANRGGDPGAKYVAGASAAVGVDLAAMKQAADQISELTKRIEEIQQASVQKSVDFIGDIQKRQIEAAANEPRIREKALKDSLDALTRTRNQQNAINDNYYKVQEARAAASSGDEIQSIIAVQRVHRQKIQQQLAEVENYYARAARLAPNPQDRAQLANDAVLERDRLQTDLQLSAIETERKIAAERKKNAEEQERAAEKARREAEQLQKAIGGIFDRVSGGNANPYLKFLTDAEKFSQSLLEVTKGLTAEQRNFLTAQNEANLNAQRSQQRASSTVEAFNLRTQARDFRRGYRLTGEAANIERNQDLSSLFNRLRRNNISQEARDKQIISATSGIDPRDLSRGNADVAAGAREREARRIEQQERNADNYHTAMLQALEGGSLKVSVANGEALVRVINEAPDKATVSTKPKAADVATYYGRQNVSSTVTYL
jgi:hypothetical protein